MMPAVACAESAERESEQLADQIEERVSEIVEERCGTIRDMEHERERLLRAVAARLLVRVGRAAMPI